MEGLQPRASSGPEPSDDATYRGCNLDMIKAPPGGPAFLVSGIVVGVGPNQRRLLRKVLRLAHRSIASCVMIRQMYRVWMEIGLRSLAARRFMVHGSGRCTPPPLGVIFRDDGAEARRDGSGLIKRVACPSFAFVAPRRSSLVMQDGRHQASSVLEGAHRSASQARVTCLEMRL